MVSSCWLFLADPPHPKERKERKFLVVFRKNEMNKDKYKLYTLLNLDKIHKMGEEVMGGAAFVEKKKKKMSCVRICGIR